MGIATRSEIEGFSQGGDDVELGVVERKRIGGVNEGGSDARVRLGNEHSRGRVRGAPVHIDFRFRTLILWLVYIRRGIRPTFHAACSLVGRPCPLR